MNNGLYKRDWISFNKFVSDYDRGLLPRGRHFLGAASGVVSGMILSLDCRLIYFAKGIIYIVIEDKCLGWSLDCRLIY